MKRLEKYTSTEDKNTIILFQYQNFFLLLVKCRKLSFGINPLQIIQYILAYSIFIPSISNWKKLFRIFAIPGCVLRENLVALKILTMLFERYSFLAIYQYVYICSMEITACIANQNRKFLFLFGRKFIILDFGPPCSWGRIIFSLC